MESVKDSENWQGAQIDLQKGEKCREANIQVLCREGESNLTGGRGEKWHEHWIKCKLMGFAGPETGNSCSICGESKDSSFDREDIEFER